MITSQYCVQMARYNAWQNGQLAGAFAGLDAAAFRQDRAGFFGSIQGTANHLLWGDMIWMARFEGIPPPQGGIAGSVAMTQGLAQWQALRVSLDARIIEWSAALCMVDLAAPLRWISGAVEASVERPLGLCIVHMFNHQIHHRGQIHTMLTQAGVTAPVSDLVFMPEVGPDLGAGL